MLCEKEGEWYTLNNGQRIPCVGLGSANMQKQSSIIDAICSLGYLCIDTAAIY